MDTWLPVAAAASGWLAAVLAWVKFGSERKDAAEKHKEDIGAVVNERLKTLMTMYDSAFAERETQAKAVLARMEELNQEKVAWLTERTALLNRVWDLESGLRRCQTELDTLRGSSA